LRLLRKREGWTQQDLADKAGVGLRTVIRLESEEPGNYQKLSLAAIAGAFGGTEAELLNWDPGAPLPSKGVHVAEVERLDRDTYAGYKPGDIPLITEAQAGEGRILYEDAASLEAYTERRVSRPEGVTDKNAFAVMVKGDSMVPVFRPGRYVVVSPNIPVAPGDEVFVALTSGERLIKIAYRADGGFVLESANPTYSPRFVKAEEIQVMYPVVWAKRTWRMLRVVRMPLWPRTRARHSFMTSRTKRPSTRCPRRSSRRRSAWLAAPA